MLESVYETVLGIASGTASEIAPSTASGTSSGVVLQVVSGDVSMITSGDAPRAALKIVFKHRTRVSLRLGKPIRRDRWYYNALLNVLARYKSDYAIKCIRKPINDSVRYNLFSRLRFRYRIGDRVRDRIRNHTSNRIWRRIWGRIWNHVRSRVRGRDSL
jgi:hypothetical protein